MGKVRSFGLAPGFAFGRDGRYQVLRRLGAGWEGETYAVADIKDDKTLPLLRAVKFRRFGKGRDWATAPTWNVSGGKRSGTPSLELVSPDLVWLEWIEPHDRKELGDLLQGIKDKIDQFRKLKDTPAGEVLSPIKDYGVVAVPCEGNFLPVVFEIMPLERGELLPEYLGRLSDPAKLARVGGNLLTKLVEAVLCTYETCERRLYLTGDFHPENVFVEAEGESVRIVDAGFESGPSKDEVRGTLTAAIALAMQVVHWDDLGMVVQAHAQDQIYVPLLDDPVKLGRFPPRLPESAKRTVKHRVIEVDPDLWPDGLWPDVG